MAPFATQTLDFLKAIADQWLPHSIPEGSSASVDPSFQPHYLSHVQRVNDDRSFDIQLLIYLPPSNPQPPSLTIQGNVGSGPWQDLNPPQPPEQPCWHLLLTQGPPNQPIHLRYAWGSQDWQPLTPLNGLETIYGTMYSPRLAPAWNHSPPAYTHAKVLMESTLEGLLAGYKGGRFAPQDIQDLFKASIADRILKTDIPGQLSEWGIDEIMVPVCSSVADRSHLDPKFNYLTYNFVNLDWQIGDGAGFQALVDRFYHHGIQLIPDLIFAHQVRKPFPGSIDQMLDDQGNAFLVDEDAFLFRDYGTWMFDLSNPQVRQLLIEKLIFFVKRFRLKVIRIDYVDGLILQYSNRDHNSAEDFIRELKAGLRQHCPEVVALGETFEVAGNEAVKDFIDVFYAPIGFTLVEELYKPPSRSDRPLYPDIHVLVNHVEDILQSPRREAYYAQLHDETWYCQHIVQGRPYVPWAYGGHPAQLAKNQGEELIQMGLLDRPNLLDFVRRTVRNAEALTMFLANLRYMYVPSVDSLNLGCLDEPDQWKVVWPDSPLPQLSLWQQATGLDRSTIINLHRQHRQDMVQLRQIFRQYTRVNEETYQPLVKPKVNHFDPDASLLSLLRWNPHYPQESLLIIFNFGASTFTAQSIYEIPIPDGFEGCWRVVFDGESSSAGGYEVGETIVMTQGQYSNRSHVIPLKIAAHSLVVLQYLPES